MSEARNGDTVKIHYTGTLADGSQFDSSREREPLELTVGAGKVIPGFERAVVGMGVGESRTVTIDAADAYGPRQEQLLQEVPRSVIPADIELSQGLMLHAQGPDGQTVNFTVIEYDDQKVLVDGNHPLAGRDLTFELELVAIV
jgi:FKBP-type peptidyl-prolyl cis-trans isomerase 2